MAIIDDRIAELRALIAGWTDDERARARAGVAAELDAIDREQALLVEARVRRDAAESAKQPAPAVDSDEPEVLRGAIRHLESKLGEAERRIASLPATVARLLRARAAPVDAAELGVAVMRETMSPLAPGPGQCVGCRDTCDVDASRRCRACAYDAAGRDPARYLDAALADDAVLLAHSFLAGGDSPPLRTETTTRLARAVLRLAETGPVPAISAGLTADEAELIKSWLNTGIMPADAHARIHAAIERVTGRPA